MVLDIMQYLLQVVKQTLVVEEEVMEMLLPHQVVPVLFSSHTHHKNINN
jgi:hypothetical protein